MVEHQTGIHLWNGHLVCTNRNIRAQCHKAFLHFYVVLRIHHIVTLVLVGKRAVEIVAEVYCRSQ